MREDTSIITKKLNDYLADVISKIIVNQYFRMKGGEIPNAKISTKSKKVQ